MWIKASRSRIPAVVGTAVAACFPKCPFCVLALLASAGISISASSTVALIIPAVAMSAPLAWLVIRPRSYWVAGAVALGVGLLAGNRMGILAGWAGWAGAVAIVVPIIGSIGLDRNLNKHSCEEVKVER